MPTFKLNKSAERVVDLLVLLANSKEAPTLNEICTTHNWPKSSTYELIQTLIEKGLLEVKDKRLKTYGLSLLAFEIGSAYLGKQGLTDQARPYLNDLNKLTGNTVFLGIEDKGDIVYLDKAESHSFMQPTAKLGSRRFMHTTGLGKALLAAYPNEKILDIINKKGLFKKTSYSHTTVKEVLQDMKNIRTRGYSVDDREDNNLMFCIGAAIYDAQNIPVAAVSVPSLYMEVTEKRRYFIAQAVVDTALQISKSLGFSKNKLYFD